MKSGIFEVQRRENMADSDPRLHEKRLQKQGFLEEKASSFSESFSDRTTPAQSS
jgi:hypothetical protein